MLAEQYYDTANPLGYAGASRLIEANKHRQSRSDIEKWLSNQDTYTLHKQVNRLFPRLHYNVRNIDDVWECDLMDYKSLQIHNDKFCYVLIVIDVLSKFVWCEPLLTKSADDVCKGFQNILKRAKPRKPVYFQSDKGKEFVCSKLQNFLKKEEIAFRETRNPDVKAACVERVIRTVKSRLHRYMHHRNTHRYIDVLQDVIKAYNNTIHSSIRMKPASVSLYNAQEARRNIEKTRKPHRGFLAKKAKFRVGQYVRISREKGVFEKGYTYNWSEEIFRVTKVSRPQGIFTYKLEDLNGEEIDSFFYTEELIAVGDDSVREDREFRVEKIVKTRGKGARKEALVKWLGYPAKFNSWVLYSTLVDI